MTKADFQFAKRAIEQAICVHMPSAAVASGWMSAVDVTPWVNAMCDRFPPSARPSDLGMPALTKWASEQGIECGERVLKELRKRWLLDRMRAES
jgi:hypothetical protein